MIDPISAYSLGEALGGITGAMAGHAAADEYADRMSDTYVDTSGLHIGVGNFTSSKPAVSGNTENTVVDSQYADPLAAVDDYLNHGGRIDSITGGFVEGSDVVTFNYSIMENTSNEAEAVAPVAIEKNKAYVAISQALGVSMDLSEVDPVFGAKLNRALTVAGIAYGLADDLITAWVDKDGNVLIPKKALEAVAEVLSEEGLLTTNEMVTNAAAFECRDPVVYAVFSNGQHLVDRGGNEWVLEIGTPDGTVRCTTRQDGKPIYVASGFGAVKGIKVAQTTIHFLFNFNHVTFQGRDVYYHYDGLFSCIGDNSPQSANNDDIKISAAILYGNVRHPAEYPEGTAESNATKYSVDSIPSRGGILYGSGDDTIDVVPIHLPENPTNTKESTTDPITYSEPEQIGALPAPPLPLPIPDTNVSNPDVPLTNPAVIKAEIVDRLVEDLANTVDPQPPQSSGLIPFPLLPGIPDPEHPGTSTYPTIVPASGSGLIHVYNPTPAEFVSFGAWLWVTYADASIEKIWNNPFDGIIGAFELYSTPEVEGSDNIRSGFLVCPTTAALVRQRYTEIDCGSVIIPEFYGNYLDYSPYSQAYIYLPFIGIVEVSIDDIVGHAINIRYRVDAYNGSCIAMIYVAKNGYRNLCYQYAGNCGVEVPLAGGSQAAIKAGMLQAEAYSRASVQSAQIQKSAAIRTGAIQGAASGVLGGALGTIMGAIAGAASGYISGNANVKAARLQGQAMQDAARVANKSSVQHSGNFGASHGAMGLKIPFIMIRNPVQVKVVNYNDDYGFPAHKRVIVGGCTGYLRVREVNVISAFATNEEKRAIEEELKSGVYIQPIG